MTEINLIEVKKTVFVMVNGVEKRAKVLSKIDETNINVQLYDGNKLQRKEDNTPIETKVDIKDVNLEKITKTGSKTNLYSLIVKTKLEETDEETGEITVLEEDKIILENAKNKDASALYKTYDVEEDKDFEIHLIKTFDAKKQDNNETTMKHRVVGKAVKPTKKSVKAVYGIKIKTSEDEEAVLTEKDLDRKTALARFKELKESAKEGEEITMITISNSKGEIVNKNTYNTFVFGKTSSTTKSLKNTWIIKVNNEIVVKDKSYNETRKEFTILKKDETTHVGTLIEMLKHKNEKGEEVNEIKYTYTFEEEIISEPTENVSEPKEEVKEEVKEDLKVIENIEDNEIEDVESIIEDNEIEDVESIIEDFDNDMTFDVDVA